MTKFFQLTQKSFSELGVSTQKELWDKVSGDCKGLSMSVKTEFVKKSVDGETKLYKVIMSTAAPDRHGDIVLQNWDLKNFLNNPVFLDSHNYNSIEFIIGKFHNVYIENGNLVGEVEFMTSNPRGALAEEMADKGFLNATSVGFIPKMFDSEGRIVESELLENSAVSVPAQAEATFVRSFEQSPDVEAPAVEIETPSVEEIIEPEGKVDMVAELAKSFARQNEDRRVKLLSALNALGEMNKANQEEKKRKIFKDLRDLL